MRSVGNPKRRWKNDIKIGRTEVGFRSWTEFVWLKISGKFEKKNYGFSILGIYEEFLGYL